MSSEITITKSMIENLPSLWQIGDYVSVTFPGTGLLKKCKVIKVSFTERGVFYDVEVPYQFYSQGASGVLIGNARIHGLDEWHLRNPESHVADIKEETD